MRYLPLDKVKPGMQLAKEIYNAKGHILVSRTAVLSKEYIERLHDYQVYGVYIEDALSAGIEPDEIISTALRVEGMSCIAQMDIDRCQKVAKEIVEELLTKKIVSLDLAELHMFDDYTYAHSVNVAVYSCVIGMSLGMGEAELVKMVLAGLLHDLGKRWIPSEILNKKERLTQEEYQIMKSHVTQSYELIKERWDIPSEVKAAVLFHHENVDGSGYPNGTEGKDQIIYTKILHVADVYDALTANRPYKKPYSPYEAAEYLMGACGILFDKEVVEAFLQYVSLYPKGTQMVLSDGREVIISENAGIHNLRPIVRLMDGSEIDLSQPEHYNVTLLAEKDDGLDAEDMRRLEKERNQMVTVKPKKHILAVDDMSSNLQALRGIFEDKYTITLLKSGRQAIKYLEANERPDLILMDIDMPEMDGIETTKRIQKMTDGEIPVLFVTALCDRNTVKICRDLNAAGYIIKPYKAVYIISEVERIINGWSERT